MGYSVRDVQARLHTLGYNAGGVDGIDGPNTRAALTKALKDKGVSNTNGLFHHSGLHRVHIHWTAGAYGDIALERRHYHVIILEDGRAVMGDLAPEANANTSDGRYAAHTRAANSGAIGVSLDAMAGATTHPFNIGKYPLTKAQLKGMAREVANLCDTYDIPVSRYSVLSHAEIEPTLGIKQRGKWDITWLPGMTELGDPVEVGDVIRSMIRKEM